MATKQAAEDEAGKLGDKKEKKASLLSGTITEKFGGSSKDVIEEE